MSKELIATGHNLAPLPIGTRARILTGTEKDHDWHDVEVIGDWNGRPRIQFANGTRMTVDRHRLHVANEDRWTLRRRAEQLRYDGDDAAAALAEDLYNESV